MTCGGYHSRRAFRWLCSVVFSTRFLVKHLESIVNGYRKGGVASGAHWLTGSALSILGRRLVYAGSVTFPCGIPGFFWVWWGFSQQEALQLRASKISWQEGVPGLSPVGAGAFPLHGVLLATISPLGSSGSGDPGPKLFGGRTP